MTDRIRTSKPRVVLASTYDIRGGAAQAAYRLHRGLLSIGVDSKMVVLGKFSEDSTVVAPGWPFPRVIRVLRRFFDGLPLLGRYPNRLPALFSVAGVGRGLGHRLAPQKYDVLNLQWVCGGFLRIEEIPRLCTKPLVWTMHDMWPFTGGCHYAGECRRFRLRCGQCPALGSNHPDDLSRTIWDRKYASWQQRRITLVAVSRWLADEASESPLFLGQRIEVIPNGLDTGIFHPVDKGEARRRLNLPLDRRLVLFGAHNATEDPRKGFRLLVRAIGLLKSKWKADQLELVIFGAKASPAAVSQLGFPTRSLGFVKDDAGLVDAYSAADVFVAPSVQEAFGQTAAEASACGTPVVAFADTGFEEVVSHMRTGFLARHNDVDDLAAGIDWVISDDDLHRFLSRQAHKQAERCFDHKVVAQRYLELYQDLLANALSYRMPTR